MNFLDAVCSFLTGKSSCSKSHVSSWETENTLSTCSDPQTLGRSDQAHQHENHGVLTPLDLGLKRFHVFVQDVMQYILHGYSQGFSETTLPSSLASSPSHGRDRWPSQTETSFLSSFCLPRDTNSVDPSREQCLGCQNGISNAGEWELLAEDVFTAWRFPRDRARGQRNVSDALCQVWMRNRWQIADPQRLSVLSPRRFVRSRSHHPLLSLRS